jgi:hypothetical protein
MPLKNNWATGDTFNASDLNTITTQINVPQGAATAYVAAAETTNGPNAWVDLSTTTDSVTVTIGSSGLVLVSLYSLIRSSVSASEAGVSFLYSGANTLSAVTTRYLISNASTVNMRLGATFLITGLTAGSTTFKMKYFSTTGVTGSFQDRQITAVPL